MQSRYNLQEQISQQAQDFSMKFVGALTAITLAVPVHSQTTVTTEQLLSACTRPDMHWIDFCNGFFQAAGDLATLSRRACIPVGTTRTDLVRLFEANAPALLSQQEDLASTSGLIVAAGIIETEFPCDE